MKNVYNKKVRLSCYNNFKKLLYNAKTKSEVRNLEIQYKQFPNCFIGFEASIELLLKTQYLKLEKQKKDNLISYPTKKEPLNFNLKDLNSIEDKINKLDNFKLKYEFKGLFNLLNDDKNLIYNPLYIRKQVIKDLNKFKSLKFFKVSYLSRFDLKKDYSFLSVKNGANKGHSKVYFITHGLYILKTVEHDDLTLKAFYIGNKYKTVLRKTNNYKKALKGEKFNLSSINAYKILNKKDSIRYYLYCNENGLNKSNRDLLRSIRSQKGRKSFSCLLEDTEERINEINDILSNYYESERKTLSISDLVHYEWELKELEENLYDWTHENNSYAPETELGDYLW